MGLKNQQLLRIFLFICFSQGGKTSFSSGSVSPEISQVGPLAETDPVSFKILPGAWGEEMWIHIYYVLFAEFMWMLIILENCMNEK